MYGVLHLIWLRFRGPSGLPGWQAHKSFSSFQQISSLRPLALCTRLASWAEISRAIIGCLLRENGGDRCKAFHRVKVRRCKPCR